MSSYQIADTHDNAAGLTAVDPQPASPGILYPRRIVAVSGEMYDDGQAYTEWIFSVLTPTQYDSLLTQFGLSSAITNLVTVKTITEDRSTWSNYNARIVKPHNPDYRRGFYRNVRFLVRELEAL